MKHNRCSAATANPCSALIGTYWYDQHGMIIWRNGVLGLSCTT